MGILWSVILVMVFSVLPVPAEVVMFRNVHLYGLLSGTLINWSGALVGAEILFVLARFIRTSWAHFAKTSGSFSYRLIVKQRTKLQRILILILVRILPVPAKIVDLSAGMIRTIGWWEFTWTTGIGMIPYQLLMILVYHGWQTRSVYTELIVAIVIVCCFVIFLRMKKRKG